LLLASGCSDSHESLTAEAIQILRETADVLSGIQDSASAEAAKPRLKELGGRWRENERQRANKRIPARELAKLEREYGAQLESAMKRYLEQVRRVQRVDGGEEALRALGEVKPQPPLRTK
jgi:hypothetical protein